MRHNVSSTPWVLLGIILVITLSVPLDVNAQQPGKTTSAEKAQHPAPAVRFVSGNSALNIPFELDGNIILLSVRVNDSKPLKFIFDTGAGISVISPQRARELGLKTKGQVRGNATGGTIKGALIHGVSLSVQGAEVSNQLIAAISFGETPCFEFDGVIGYDFINQFVVEIDYLNSIMNLYSPATYTYSGKGEVIPLALGRTPLARTLIILEGREPIECNLEVDTGGDGTFIINSPFVEKQKLLAAIPQTVESSGVGAGGEQKLVVGRVKAVQLGRLVIDNTMVGLSLDTEGSGASEENDGIIGGEIFRRFKLILDYSRKQMILEPNKSFSEPYERDMSGFIFAFDKEDCKTVKIELVAKNSPAFEADLRSGDIITAIDGKPTDSFPSTELEKIFKQNGKELTLTVKRGKGLLQKRIKLRRLF